MVCENTARVLSLSVLVAAAHVQKVAGFGGRTAAHTYGSLDTRGRVYIGGPGEVSNGRM